MSGRVRRWWLLGLGAFLTGVVALGYLRRRRPN